MRLASAAEMAVRGFGGAGFGPVGLLLPFAGKDATTPLVKFLSCTWWAGCVFLQLFGCYKLLYKLYTAFSSASS